jgi:predicted nucleic acid-binding Zn ribbon protein
VSRTRGFRRLGEVGPEQLDLPAGRASQLRLAAAWRRVAGDLVARRTTALAVRRGVLELQVADESWAGTLEALVPSLAERLSAECPGLGIRKVRWVRAGS